LTSRKHCPNIIFCPGVPTRTSAAISDRIDCFTSASVGSADERGNTITSYPVGNPADSSETLAIEAFEAIARDRVADAARHGETETQALDIVRTA